MNITLKTGQGTVLVDRAAFTGFMWISREKPHQACLPDGVLMGLLPESGRQQLSQDIRQDTAMTEVIDFNRGVDAQQDFHSLF